MSGKFRVIVVAAWTVRIRAAATCGFAFAPLQTGREQFHACRAADRRLLRAARRALRAARLAPTAKNRASPIGLINARCASSFFRRARARKTNLRGRPFAVSIGV